MSALTDYFYSNNRLLDLLTRSKQTRQENPALFLIFRTAALLSGRHEIDQIPAGKYEI